VDLTAHGGASDPTEETSTFSAKEDRGVYEEKGICLLIAADEDGDGKFAL
jgi:hypothetical protein